jgi:hypothetical protein
MYYHVQAAHSLRLSMLSHCHAAAGILLDSSAKLMNLYAETGDRALRNHDQGVAATVGAFGSLAPQLVAGHLRIAVHLQEGLVHLMEAQLRDSSRVVRFGLEKVAELSPPEVEAVIDTVGAIIETGESIEKVESRMLPASPKTAAN